MERFRKQTLTALPEQGAERGGKGFKFKQSKIWSQDRGRKGKERVSGEATY